MFSCKRKVYALFLFRFFVRVINGRGATCTPLIFVKRVSRANVLCMILDMCTASLELDVLVKGVVSSFPV